MKTELLIWKYVVENHGRKSVDELLLEIYRLELLSYGKIESFVILRKVVDAKTLDGDCCE